MLDTPLLFALSLEHSFAKTEEDYSSSFDKYSKASNSSTRLYDLFIKRYAEYKKSTVNNMGFFGLEFEQNGRKSRENLYPIKISGSAFAHNGRS